jgi:hypothetical protein
MHNELCESSGIRILQTPAKGSIGLFVKKVIVAAAGLQFAFRFFFQN